MAIVGLPIALPVVWDLTHPASKKSLFNVVIADGGFVAYATYFLMMAVFSTIPLISAFGFWNCSFRRRFVFSGGMLEFRGAPGTAFVTNFENIQTVVIFARQHRSIWTCNVALQIRRDSRVWWLCINNDPVCGPDEHAEHRYQIDWLIDAHRPLAELLSRVIDKPIQIEQQIGLRPFRRSFHALWR